jgi:hypothetical protein
MRALGRRAERREKRAGEDGEAEGELLQGRASLCSRLSQGSSRHLDRASRHREYRDVEAAGQRCVWDPDDALLIMGALADVIAEVRAVKAMLEEDGEEEEEDET